MNDHPNAIMLREAFQAIRAGDMSRVEGFWAEEIEWHVFGRDEPIRRRDELMAYLTEEGEIETTFDVHDIVGNDEHVVALTNDTASRDGRTIAYRTARIYHVRDGKFVARWEFSDDTGRIEQFYRQGG